MDQGLDNSKPSSTSYRDTFRRHRKLFCLPIILGGLAAAFFVFGMGKTYTTTAHLWVDTSATAPSSVGDSTGSPLAEPPAASEQAVLTELLTTRTFTAAVAQNSLLGKSSPSADANGGDVPSLPGQLVTSVPGEQVLQLSYSASSPALAESLLGAVIAQLRKYTERLRVQHDQAAVAYAREQVTIAQAGVVTARRNVAAYRERHPGVGQTDPKYVSVVAAEKNAVKQLAAANTALSEMPNTGGSGSWSVRVIDPPGQATAMPLRKKKVVEVILGGMLGGLLVSFLAVVALTPAKKEAWEDELPVWKDELPIGGPLVPDKMSPDASFWAGSPGDWRVPVQTPSAPTEEQ